MLVWVMVAALVMGALGGPAFAGSAEPIRLGAILPLTGPIAGSGQDMRAGYTLALEEINAAGGVLGRPVEVIFEDDRGDPATGVAAFEKLINRDRVDIILGGLSSTVTYAIAAPAKRYRPLMAWTGAAARAVEQAFEGADWFFHYHPWEYHNLAATTEFMVSTGAKRVAIFYEDGLFGQSGKDLATQQFTEKGLQVVLSESFKTGAGEFTPLLIRARAANPDILYWIGYDADAVPLMTQMRELNWTPKLVYGAPPTWPVGFAQQPVAQYVAGLTFWTPDIPDPVSRQFVEKYVARFGQRPNSYWAPLAYTNLVTVVDAIRRAGTTDKRAVAAELAKTDYRSPLGRRLTFKPSRLIPYQGFTEWVSFQWMNGKQEIVYPPELATAKLVYPVPAWNER